MFIEQEYAAATSKQQKVDAEAALLEYQQLYSTATTRFVQLEEELMQRDKSLAVSTQKTKVAVAKARASEEQLVKTTELLKDLEEQLRVQCLTAAAMPKKREELEPKARDYPQGAQPTAWVIMIGESQKLRVGIVLC